MGAKYSYTVWGGFTHHASTIRRTSKTLLKSRSDKMFLKCYCLGPHLVAMGLYLQGVVLSWYFLGVLVVIWILPFSMIPC